MNYDVKVIALTGDKYAGRNLIWENTSLYVEISPSGEMTDVTNSGDPRPGVRAQSGSRLNLESNRLTSKDVGWEDRGGGNAHRSFVPDENSLKRLTEALLETREAR